MLIAPVHQEIVLVGGGHTHALVLRRWAMQPLPGVRLILVSPQVLTPYSGMLPGLIAGHYGLEETHIDLVKLSLWANIRFIQDAVVAIDPNKRILSLKNHPPLSFDLASLDIGSTPNREIEGADLYSIPVKPISRFYARWQALLQGVEKRQIQSLAVIGGGAGSVELILALAFRLESLQSPLKCHLITASADLLPSYPPGVKKRVKQALKNAGIQLHTAKRVVKLAAGEIHCQSGEIILADQVILCTQATGATWLRQSALATDPGGFIQVRPSLQTLDYDHIFAAGDIAEMVATPRPKAGVYAVRQAPTLDYNLRAILLKQPLRTYQPQAGFLSLLSLGQKTAVGSKGFFCLAGDWVWRWKDQIDRKFMAKFEDLTPMKPVADLAVAPVLLERFEQNAENDPLKRCAGCGAKIGAGILESVVETILGPGQYQPQDAVPLQQRDLPLYQSVDALKAPIQDPWLFGQIAVNHALSDLYAMHLQPVSAQVLITLPYAGQKIQRRQLTLLMQGILKQLNALNCQFLGGHTSEAVELSVSLVAQGSPKNERVFTKSGLQVGDKLVLSKPLGTGLILAAAMQGQVTGAMLNAALEAMLQANAQAAEILGQIGVRGCTDVTGFGFLGHLFELCKASHCGATVDLQAIPVLSGIETLIQAGIRSSLYGQNFQALACLDWPPDLLQAPKFQVLLDPQTSGGLLAGVPPEIYAELGSDFHQNFYTVGEVCEYSENQPQIRILG